ENPLRFRRCRGRLTGISERSVHMAGVDPFRPGWTHHITRRRAWRAAPRCRDNSRASTLHVLLEFRRVPQQSEIVERIGAIQLAGVDQAHEQITDPGSVHCLIEECVLAVQDGFLQGTLNQIMPPPRLCRVLRLLAQPAWFLTVPDAA